MKVLPAGHPLASAAAAAAPSCGVRHRAARFSKAHGGFYRNFDSWHAAVLLRHLLPAQAAGAVTDASHSIAVTGMFNAHHA
jgi:hypothetical protein